MLAKKGEIPEVNEFADELINMIPDEEETTDKHLPSNTTGKASNGQLQ